MIKEMMSLPMTARTIGAEAFKELAKARRRNADTVVPGIGRARLGKRTALKVRVFDWDPIHAEH
jgi:hypothetical protein